MRRLFNCQSLYLAILMSVDSLDIENGVLWVHSSLILCSLANQALFCRERDEGGCSEGALLVGNDLKEYEC